jgi:hypothetical protein
MKNASFTVLMLVAGYVFLSSCKKDGGSCNCTPVATVCRVESYSFPWETYAHKITFSYNAQNDPLSYVVTANDTIFIEARFFKYDDQNRLTGTLYSSTDSAYPASIPTRYTYPDDSTIIDIIGRDTFHLDNKSRVVRISYSDVFEGYPLGSVFRYDADGNLIRRDGEVYDKNSKNIRSTSKVWQFLDLDYSVNMSTHEGYDYTAAGLPSRLDYNGYPFLGYDLESGATAAYSCK